MKKTISIDFDGVLNMYEGNYDENNLPPLRIGAKEFLEELSKNYSIEIYTTRNKKMVFLWLQSNSLLDFIKDITNVKNPYTSVFIDDRAINFDGTYSQLISKINSFKPHWK